MKVEMDNMPFNIFYLHKALPFLYYSQRDMGGPNIPLDFSSSEETKNHKNILGSHTKKMILLKFKFQLDHNIYIFVFLAPHMVLASKWVTSNYLSNELI